MRTILIFQHVLKRDVQTTTGDSNSKNKHFRINNKFTITYFALPSNQVETLDQLLRDLI